MKIEKRKERIAFIKTALPFVLILAFVAWNGILAINVAQQQRLNQTLKVTLDEKLEASEYLDGEVTFESRNTLRKWNDQALRMMRICDSLDQVIPIHRGHIHSVAFGTVENKGMFYLPPGGHQFCVRSKFFAGASLDEIEWVPLKDFEDAKETIIELTGGEAYSVNVGLDDSLEMDADENYDTWGPTGFAVVKISLVGSQIKKVVEIANPVPNGEIDEMRNFDSEDKIVLPNAIPAGYFMAPLSPSARQAERAALLSSKQTDVELQNFGIAVKAAGKEGVVGSLHIHLSIRSTSDPGLIATDSKLFTKFFFPPYPTPKSLNLKFDRPNNRFVPAD